MLIYSPNYGILLKVVEHTCFDLKKGAFQDFFENEEQGGKTLEVSLKCQ